MQERLPQPNFIILGAQKAGTSSLYHYLKHHPAVFMSAIKEPGYFCEFRFIQAYLERKSGIRVNSREEILVRYMLPGYQGQPLFGEASTFYAYGHNSTDQSIPKRIRELSPGVKFIYILRNPFARLISNYLHDCRERYAGVKPDLDTYLISRAKKAVMGSLYYHQLWHYWRYFDRSRFKIVLFEEMAADSYSVVQAVLEFLGAGKMASKDWAGDRTVFKSILNQSRNREDFSTEDLRIGKDVYRRLLRAIQRDIAHLENATGISFDLWDLSPKTWCRGKKGSVVEVAAIQKSGVENIL